MRRLIVLLLVLLPSLPVAAREPAPAETTYDFADGDTVEGARAIPWGERIPDRRRGARETLIRPRPHFVPEMLRSVERL